MSAGHCLAQNKVFSSLPPSEIQKIETLGIKRKYAKGEFVTYQGDEWPYLLFVRTGEFQALKESRSGRSFVIENFKPGEIFWGLALFERGKRNPVAIRTAIQGRLLLLHKTHVEDIISWNTQVAWGLFSLLAQKMSRVGEMVEELVFQPLNGRLANLLIEQFDMAGGDVISRELTLDQMAARIGSTREMVCKILYQFSDQAIIDIQRTQLKIKDRLRLYEIASRMKG
jgi:CRP/FNR family transcriptional regulator